MPIHENLEKLIDIHLEWVNRPLRSGAAGYYRRVPGTRSNPTLLQAEVRLAFSEVATSTYHTKGTVKIWDHRKIPQNAAHIGNEMRDRKFKPHEPQLTKWERILRKLLTMD